MAFASQAPMAAALAAMGLGPGGTVFWASQSPSGPEDFAPVAAALQEVLGPGGTICAPAYTRSFFRGQVYDPRTTPALESPFGEWLRQQEGSLRSNDPLYSVCALGSQAETLTQGPPGDTLGKDSFWARFLMAGGVLLGWDAWLPSQLVHHLEWKLKAPYRYDKLFTGRIISQAEIEKAGVVYCGRDLSKPGLVPELEPFAILAEEFELVRRAPLGVGELLAVEADQLLDLARESLKAEPWFFVEREEDEPPHEEPGPHIPLAPYASMQEMVRTLGPAPRHLISQGYDAALSALGGQLPMIVHEYPTGYHAWTWIVPEAWSCVEAGLQTLSGETVFSTDDHPLHAVSSSLPFAGVVSREELFTHLHTHRLSGAVPFVFKYYERDWGLCCSKEQKERLGDDRYRVSIQSRLSPGRLKVGEVMARGKSPRSFVLSAHLCHPCQVNDGLSGVAVGMEVMRRLRNLRDLNYTYRLLILPETIGSLCWLSSHPDLLPQLGGGIFLEMLGLDQPHALQLSYAQDTSLDRLLKRVMGERDPASWSGPFRGVVGNDERQFNAPGLRIPMLSLSRSLPMEDANYPFPAYHSSLDDVAACDSDRLQESLELVLAMIQEVEEKRILDLPLVQPRTPARDGSPVPQPLFCGEVFCSRYGLHVDWFQDPQGNRRLFDVLALIDGEHSQAEIADLSGASPEMVAAIVGHLKSHGLAA